MKLIEIIDSEGKLYRINADTVCYIKEVNPKSAEITFASGDKIIVPMSIGVLSNYLSQPR